MTAKELQAKLSEWPGGASSFAFDNWTVHLVAEENSRIAGLVREMAVVRTGTAPDRTLKQWGEAIAKSASGLAESLKLLEIDEVQKEALLRSDKPSKDGPVASYFEVKLFGQSKAVVHRYSADTKAGTPREQVAFPITHEALAKLAADIAA